MNVDYVYRVESIVKPGETISAYDMTTHPGGKGANQSVAMARAGVEVWHAGLLGSDTQWLREVLGAEGVDVRHVRVSDSIPGGNAIIQVDKNGMNSIIVLGGTNHAIEPEHITTVFADADAGDWLALQNEINHIPELMQAAKKAGMKICLNPAPFTEAVLEYPLDYVDLLVVNEIEAAGLAGMLEDSGPEQIAGKLAEQYPGQMLCMTLGGKGALFHSAATGLIFQPAFKVNAVDTTAAGDTFTGFLLAGLSSGKNPADALEDAAKAAAISVTRNGAVPSIPKITELTGFHCSK